MQASAATAVFIAGVTGTDVLPNIFFIDGPEDVVALGVPKILSRDGLESVGVDDTGVSPKMLSRDAIYFKVED